ncbi:unnamed protein product, partial [Polarella glacialis]
AGNSYWVYKTCWKHESLLEDDYHEGRIIPPCFRCPISQDVMKDPVITVDGHTYERKSIEEWFNQGRRTSPLTNLPLDSQELLPNLVMRQAVADFAARLAPEMRRLKKKLEQQSAQQAPLTERCSKLEQLLADARAAVETPASVVDVDENDEAMQALLESLEEREDEAAAMRAARDEALLALDAFTAQVQQEQASRVAALQHAQATNSNSDNNNDNNTSNNNNSNNNNNNSIGTGERAAVAEDASNNNNNNNNNNSNKNSNNNNNRNNSSPGCRQREELRRSKVDAFLASERFTGLSASSAPHPATESLSPIHQQKLEQERLGKWGTKPEMALKEFEKVQRRAGGSGSEEVCSLAGEALSEAHAEVKFSSELAIGVQVAADDAAENLIMGVLHFNRAMGGSSSGSSATRALSRPPRGDLQNGDAGQLAVASSARRSESLLGFLPRRSSSVGSVAAGRHAGRRESLAPEIDFPSSPRRRSAAEGHPPGRFEPVESLFDGEGECEAPLPPPGGERRGFEDLVSAAEAAAAEGAVEGAAVHQQEAAPTTSLGGGTGADNNNNKSTNNNNNNNKKNNNKNIFGLYSRRSQSSRRASSAVPLPSGSGSGRFSSLWRRPGPTTTQQLQHQIDNNDKNSDTNKQQQTN